jgi:type I restriction enzyme, R subunit
MNANAYSEDQMLQAGTAGFFEEHLGWRSEYAFDREDYGPDSLLGRSHRGEVVLLRPLRKALKKLNPKAPAAAIEAAISMLVADDVGKSLAQINEDKHKLLLDGVPVQARDDAGQLGDYVLTVIDFARPERNDFLMVRELWIEGLQPRRADLVGFVNGLPLLFIEVKRYDKDVKLGFDKNLTDYKRDIRHLFFFNAFVVLSNGHDALFGSITSPWEHFYRWRRLNEADPMPPKEAPLLETLLRGMGSKTVLLDIVQSFTAFDHSEGAAQAAKIVARNHQYLGVNRVVQRLVSAEPTVCAEVAAGRLGVFWHTQGSGKSYSMVFLVNKVRRTLGGQYSFLVVTDRIDLDGQIAGTFANCDVIADAKAARIPDSASVADRLNLDLRVQFALVQKFKRFAPEGFTGKADLIVLSDEAHRTQYGTLAWNMRRALPKAKFLGFTGTPLIEAKERQLTRDVFGEYVSVYDFKRAVEDDSTVRLFYENRGGKLTLIDPDVHEKIRERIEAAYAAGEIDEDQEEALYRKLAQEYPLVTSRERLQKVAADLVGHYTRRWNTGKAMLVCWDKLTCGRMYAYIQESWQARIAELETKREAEAQRLAAKELSESQYLELLDRQLAWLKETEICVVISGADSKELTKEYAVYGLDLAPHARKLAARQLDEEFKRAEHPFRLVIVCAMWLTGFDVKSLATLYLDKPMQGHTLMQAIARVNRVYKDKKSGWVVDYNGMVRSLRRALATFAARADDSLDNAGVDPLEDDKAAVADYAASVKAARGHIEGLGFDLELLMTSQRLEKLEPLAFAVGCVKRNDETRMTFNVLVEAMQAKFRALFPHPDLAQYYEQHDALSAIYNKLNERPAIKDISTMLYELRDVIEDALGFEAPKIAEPTRAPYDISKIDFERLQQEFARAERQQETFDLKERIENRLARMLRANPGRVDLYEKYQRIIRDYNREKDAAEISRIFEQLMALDKELDEEERRFVREGFDNDEQLAIFDLLQKENLKPAEIDSIRKAAKELLPKLEERRVLADHWQQRAASRAQVETAILDHLYEELPEAFDENEVRLLSARVLGLMMRPDGERRLH